MELLKENYIETQIESVIEESTNEKKWYLSGPTLMAEEKNLNKRVYPLTVLEKAISTHIEGKLENGRCVGELSHPLANSQEINLENISHKFLSVKKEGNIFYTKAQIVDTPKGKIAKNLLQEGIKLGFSSRALGSINESNGIKIVKECQIISLADIVFDPSIGQLAEAINEQKEWIYENGVIMQVDLSEEMDTYKKLLKESKAKDIQSTVKSILADYFKKLSL